MSEHILETIKTRRVIRHMTDEPVERAQLEKILEAARWAPSGGNLRPHRFVVVQDAETRRLIRLVAPGMFQHAAALILICINWDVVDFHKWPRHSDSILIDVGTAAQNIMLTAHALGLASGPVTSFSTAAVRVILNLPENFSPEMFICIGHAAPRDQTGMRAWGKTTWQSLTYWERFEE